MVDPLQVVAAAYHYCIIPLLLLLLLLLLLVMDCQLKSFSFSGLRFSQSKVGVTVNQHRTNKT